MPSRGVPSGLAEASFTSHGRPGLNVPGAVRVTEKGFREVTIVAEALRTSPVPDSVTVASTMSCVPHAMGCAGEGRANGGLSHAPCHPLCYEAAEAIVAHRGRGVAWEGQREICDAILQRRRQPGQKRSRRRRGGDGRARDAAGAHGDAAVCGIKWTTGVVSRHHV